MGKDDGPASTKRHKRKPLKEPRQEDQKIWTSIAKNYEMIEGALNESKEPVGTTEISRTIALYSGGHITIINYYLLSIISLGACKFPW